MDDANWQLSSGAGLASVAPTVLQLMGITPPAAMRARSLLLRELPGKRVRERWPPRPLRGVA